MAQPQFRPFTLASAPPPTLGCSSSFQWAERAPHVPHVASRTKQLQSSESQALCKKEKAAKPWVLTVGSHILAYSLLSAPGPSCHPQEAQRANVQVRVTSQSPRKRLQQKYTQHLCLLLSTCTVAQGTCPGVGWPGVRNQHLIS